MLLYVMLRNVTLRYLYIEEILIFSIAYLEYIYQKLCIYINKLISKVK